MKIISGYKDYYDYLSGVYGIDPLVVLDRRSGTKVADPYIPSDRGGTKVQLVICDMVYDGWFDGEYHWGPEVIDVLSPKQLEEYVIANKSRDKPYINMSTRSRYDTSMYIYIKPYKSTGLINTKLQCPIILNADRSSEQRYPILKDLSVQGILPPHDIYLMLSAWLAPKDNHIDTRTDKDKILTNGFDIKTSFRHG